jgi:uncharacterized protein
VTDRPTATASVATQSPARYAKQLASHLGRRCEVREEADGVRIVFADGDCLLTPADGALELLATADSAASLDRVAHVVGSHLERFGQRNELQVSWLGP